MKKKLNSIRNMRELSLYKQNLRYKQKLYEQEVAGVTADVVDHFADKVKDLAYDLGAKLLTQLFTRKSK